MDLETTGLNPARDRILEIGAVKIRDGQEAGQFQMLINPRMEIPERIRELTGITDEMVRGSLPPGRLWKPLRNLRPVIPCWGII